MYELHSDHSVGYSIMLCWSFALLLPWLVQSHPLDQDLLPIDCEDVFFNVSIHNGVYTIYPVGKDSPMEVYCHMGYRENESHEGGRWTVIQRRINGKVDFYRNWDDYKRGFGDKSGEYWLGLQNIFLLTHGMKYELRVDMEDWEGGTVYALYGSFFLGPESDGYRLHVFDFIDGGAGNSLIYHNGQKFSTFDKDQDPYSRGNCAVTFRGGFWYHAGAYANPNGEYKHRDRHNGVTDGVFWSGWKGHRYSQRKFSMKVRRVPFSESVD
ncbi:microfibril-associated glycoprotein 4-like [Sardina pilchardus]|uniref:microfibril-associated glycoprotein 4-like n=1 Tax=Sardina pilchardus TaxID=27697 RepID=UPI002E0D46C9